jgi:hypothetical protein
MSEVFHYFKEPSMPIFDRLYVQLVGESVYFSLSRVHVCMEVPGFVFSLSWAGDFPIDMT